MKITKSQLRQVIQEELQNVLNEATDSMEFNPSSRRDINAAYRRHQRTGGTSGINKDEWRKARRALARDNRRGQAQGTGGTDVSAAPTNGRPLSPGAGGYAKLPAGTQPADILDALRTGAEAITPTHTAAREYVRDIRGPQWSGVALPPAAEDRLGALRTGADAVMNPPAESGAGAVPAPAEPPAGPPAPTTGDLANRHRARQEQRNTPSPGSTEDWQARLNRYKSQQANRE